MIIVCTAKYKQRIHIARCCERADIGVAIETENTYTYILSHIHLAMTGVSIIEIIAQLFVHIHTNKNEHNT